MRFTRAMALVMAALFFDLALVPAAAADQRAIYAVRVNTVDKADDVVALTGGGDIRMLAGDIAKLGIRLPHGITPSADGYVSLNSLAPILTYRVDETDLVLDLSVAAAYLLSNTSIALSSTDAQVLYPVARSAFLNYAVSTNSAAGVTFSGEAGTHVGSGFLSSTFYSNGRNSANGSLTSWVSDDVQKARRLTVGDVAAYSGDLGGGAIIEGVSIKRDFGINGEASRSVLPGIIGTVQTPTLADIYVNGTLYKQVTIQPGQFDLRNLPVSSGANNTQVVLTDAFGRQQTIAQNFYQTSALLAKGSTDYEYAVGAIRQNGYDSPSDAGMAATARYAVGVSDSATAGARFEAAPNIFSGGTELAVRLPSGVLGLAGAVSRSASGVGEAALLSYQHALRSGFIDASITSESAGYSTLGDASLFGHPLLSAQLEYMMTTSDRNQWSFAYAQRRYQGIASSGDFKVTQNHFVGNRVMLQLSADDSTTGGRNIIGFGTSLQFLTGANIETVRADDEGGNTSVNATFAHSGGNGTTGVGYQAAISNSGGQTSLFGEAQLRSRYGDYFATLGTGGGSSQTTLTASGGIVAIDRHFFATEPVYDSYAVIDTQGTPNVPITSNGVRVGRTDARGFLFVPSLGSYYANQMQIDAESLPMDLDVASMAQSVVPSYRSGNVVRFAMRLERPVMGRIVVDRNGKITIPAYGVLELQAGVPSTRSDIGENGEFYFDNVQAGDYPARVVYRNGQCSFNLHVPSSNDPFLRIGTVRCEDKGK